MIFYFTATGNSLYAAQKLGDRLETELYSIPDLIRKEHCELTARPGEYVGFVFPVFFWGLPDILHRFVSRLRIRGADPKRTFVVATMGGLSGTACEQMEKLLSRRGIQSGYKFSVIMPDNYVPYYTMPDREEVERQLNAADVQLEEIAQILLEGKTGAYNKHKGVLPALASPLIHLTYPRSTKRFFTDSACTGCGLCQRVCPVGAIQVDNGLPRWVKERCEVCLACLHRCPTQAIQHGKDRRNKGRYLNPRVTLPVGEESL